MSTLYFDWAATAPPDPEIEKKINDISRQVFANPSSLHRAGRQADRLLGQCRKRLAAVLGCSAEEIVFTSGGTESNNMVLFSQLHRKSRRRIVISGIEHPSLYHPAGTLERFGFEVARVPAKRSGRVDPERLVAAIDENTVLVAIMLVNNETGAIQSVGEVAAALREHERRSGGRIHLHTDAVQAFGKIPFEPQTLGVDSASLSAHKIRGPRGVGALYLRRQANPQFLYSGGGQESGKRPGTENLPGIYGFTLAAEKAARHLEENLEKAQGAMRAFIGKLSRIPGLELTNEGREREGYPAFSPFILNLSFPPLPGEVTVRVLEEEGMIISTGSACSSKNKDRFRVLENMHVPRKTAMSSVRISIGPDTDPGELLRLAEAIGRRIPEQIRVTAG